MAVVVGQPAAESCGRGAAVSNLLKNRFSSSAPPTQPSNPMLPVFWNPLMVLIPLHASLILQLSLVIVLSHPDVKFEYPLHSPHLVMVAIAERPLLLIQDDLNVLSDPRFIVSVTGYSLSRDIAVHT